VRRGRCAGKSAYDYFLQLVPTQFTDANGDVTTSYQYSATEFEHTAGGDGHHAQMRLPVVSFKYDFSPISVQMKQEHRGVLSFLTSICAIVGGVFAMSGFVNSVVYRSSVMLSKQK
jgi:hypothetical protein